MYDKLHSQLVSRTSTNRIPYPEALEGYKKVKDVVHPLRAMPIKRWTNCILLLLGCVIFTAAHYPSHPGCKDILLNTIASVEKIQTLRFHLKCNERIEGKLLSTESQVKLGISPRRIYIYLKGPELLWVKGKNKGQCLVNPQGFPFVNLSLDPMGNIMREKQHHTIHQMGFEYFSDVIKNSIRILGVNFDTYFKCTGTLSWNNRECYYISADYPDFAYIDYTVQKGESLVSIAHKLKVSDYMLLEINAPKVRHYYDVKANQVIKVPNVYGRKMVLYIDKELMIPRVIKVYDDKGLFESYEYHELELNPAIPDEEFTKEFKGYKF